MYRFLSKVHEIIFFTAILISAGACSQGPPVPFPAFDFVVEDLFTGEEIHLAEMKGRPVLVYFFASW